MESAIRNASSGIRVKIKKTRISPWHFLWISVIMAEVFTLAGSLVQEYFFWGHISREVLIIGAVDSLLAPLLISPVTIIFVAQISKLQQQVQSYKEAEKRISYLAYYDSLTNLPNRTLFKELFKRALSNASREGSLMAILFLDLDHFKRINDTLGHATGDRLLQAVTNRLIKSTRSSDSITRLEDDTEETVSRLGGDEFVLLLNKVNVIHDAGKVASRILRDLSEPFDLDGREVFITGSIGISLFPSDGDDAEDLLKNADAAMYHAKTKGRNNYQYYSKSMNIQALEYLTLANKLYKAVGNQEFVLYYQPKRSISGTKITGVESLLRWKPGGSDLVLPSQFIPLLEETGLIIPVGEWVLRTACMQGKKWISEGYEPIAMSVNVSSRQFDQKNLVEIVTRALDEAKLDPRYLELEITESTIMQDPEEAIDTLLRLKNMGIGISIDDFGIGYSSLNYLRRVPLDSLKIDRSFISNLTTSHSDSAIIKAIISLAHSLNLQVVAEGVENNQQIEFLRENGCDEVQGFLIGKPMPSEQVSQLLTRKI